MYSKIIIIIVAVIFCSFTISAEFDLFETSSSSSSGSSDSGSDINYERSITFDDFAKKCGKIEKGLIWTCRCGHHNKVLGVVSGQTRRLKCGACGKNATMKIHKNPQIIVTCPYCGTYELIIGRAKEGIYSCKKCNDSFVVVSGATLARFKKEKQENIAKGLVRYEDEWVAPNDYTNRMMAAKGLVKYGNEWVTPDKYTNQLMTAKGFVKHSNEWISKEDKAKFDTGLLPYNGQWVSSNEYRLVKITAADYEGIVNCSNEYLLSPPAAGVNLLKDRIVEYTGIVIHQVEQDEGAILCMSWHRHNGFKFTLAPQHTDMLLNIKEGDIITIRGIHSGDATTMQVTSRTELVYTEKQRTAIRSYSNKYGELPSENSIDIFDLNSGTISAFNDVSVQIIENAQVVSSFNLHTLK